NRAALARRALRPRFLVDVSTCDLSGTLLGARLAAPLGVAPMAYHRLVHPDGEVATARAAGAAGALLVVSPFASRSIEDIAAAASGPVWLQLYWLHRREALVDLVARAEAAGYGAIVLTVDTPRVGRRLRDIRHGFALPDGVAAVNLPAEVMATAHQHAGGGSALQRHSREQFDPSLSWTDLAWLRGRTSLPLVLKGLVTAEDARLAVAHGADAVIVSNHGGRQLDHAVSTVDALPEVVAAVAGACPVLVDGGFRTGTEVLVALALGARAVLLGRPVLWGLACAGADGAGAVLRTVVEELEDAMVLSGRPRLADVDSSLVRSVGA
ncbi:MAG TPA: alpha-hydroxy acid oxidase, partial [Rugosimonospora sp.]|nr:alpha-hydroxy acid oxidase [Rugosimonospora sp.]